MMEFGGLEENIKVGVWGEWGWVYREDMQGGGDGGSE